MSDAEHSELVSTLADGVLHVCMNRPEKKNAFTEAMYGTFARLLGDADALDDIRVVLVSGAAGTFTAGNDLGDFLEHPPTGDDAKVFGFLTAITRLQTPIVAAVRGAAVGIGTTMLQHMDLVYAADNARFSLPFVNLGLCPEAASSLLLPRQMGHARAAELLLLGKPFDAATAQAAGLVTGICADADVEATAMEVARALARKPPEAVRVTKALMRRWDREHIERAIAIEGEAFVRQLQSAEAKAAFSAFLGRKGGPRESK